MDKRLSQVQNGQEENYALPFLWMHDGHHEELPMLVKQVYDSGVRAFCIESRPHEHFCEQEWWDDMDVVFAEAEKLGMKVWILDDKHFPTGYANGLLKKKYPELRKWHLVEEHVDVIGPAKDCSVLLRAENADPEDQLLAVYAFKREKEDESLPAQPIDLTKNVFGRYVYWDIPEGVYRIFALYKSRRGASDDNYVHMIDPESVHVLIEAVYEPHYAHYAKYFGNTFCGFFSDEPCLGNTRFTSVYETPSIYDQKLGQPGLALPWSEEVLRRMREELGGEVLEKLVGLWYTQGDGEPEVRLAYMNAVTRLWQEAFSEQLGNWCRAHNVEYIGHVIEDMNCHARLSYSGGHYFRSLAGQDMAGIDVVLHQIMPGMAHHLHTCSSFGGYTDPAFFDYMLARLAASHAHIEPRMQRRAMCEIFGAYGWGENIPMMKHLMDHMLVRGINRFVPHAFSPKFPDPDCPPHFNGGGKNPQFEAFTRLMRYTNQAAHLLGDAEEYVSAAILYHAEAEWSGREYMLSQVPARELYDAQLNYDFLPIDAIMEKGCAENGSLAVEKMRYPALIIPYSAYLPEKFVEKLDELAEAGVPVAYINGRPMGAKGGKVLALSELAAFVAGLSQNRVALQNAFPLLRTYHGHRDGADVFMLVNEDMTKDFSDVVTFPVSGKCVCADLSKDVFYADIAEGGKLSIQLARGESLFIVFGDGADAFGKKSAFASSEILQGKWLLSLKKYDESDFGEKHEITAFKNITGRDGDPDFSGSMRYETVFTAKENAVGIDLGVVGDCCRVELNGKDLGILMAAPYAVFMDALREGENRLTVTVYNTLVHAVPDWFSKFDQIGPSGLLGEVRILYGK